MWVNLTRYFFQGGQGPFQVNELKCVVIMSELLESVKRSFYYGVIGYRDAESRLEGREGSASKFTKFLRLRE